MQTESLARLVFSADFLTFRSIAIDFMERRGFLAADLVDGPHDGGTDLRLFVAHPSPTQIAVQVTVDRKWEQKITQDARKVRDRLGLIHIFFLCNYRIPEARFTAVADMIFRETAVNVTRFDGQTIASSYHQWGATHRLLELCDLPIPARPEAANRMLQAKLLAADSFLAFSEEATDFRSAVREAAAIAVIYNSERALLRNECAAAIANHLGLPVEQHRQIESLLDRLIQRRDLQVSETGIMVISSAKRSSLDAAAAVTSRDRIQLAEDIRLLLRGATQVRTIGDSVVNPILDAAGAAALAAGYVWSSNALDANGEPSLRALRTRLRNLHAALDAAAVPDGVDTRSAIVTSIAEVVSASPYGQCLAAAELYFNIAILNEECLATILGGGLDADIMLDASVAMPMLSSLLFRPAGSRFSFSAHRLYRSAEAHGLRL
ncbi:MAG: hypothetical protein IPM94_11480 [bacterium]|nr:hypothetical protein [bacterium]